MRHSSSTLEALHRLSSRNRDTVQGTRACGCFHCLRTFDAAAVVDWTREGDGQEETALCPFCGSDSVMPAREGAPIDPGVLKAMQVYWYGRTASSDSQQKDAAGKIRVRLEPLLRRLTWDLWESRKE